MSDGLLVDPGGEEGAVAQSGASLFPHLVWAHFRWERHRRGDESDQALEEAYREKLTSFESKVGKLEEVYWSTRAASAVAMTVWREGDERGTDSRRATSAWRKATRG